MTFSERLQQIEEILWNTPPIILDQLGLASVLFVFSVLLYLIVRVGWFLLSCSKRPEVWSEFAGSYLTKNYFSNISKRIFRALLWTLVIWFILALVYKGIKEAIPFSIDKDGAIDFGAWVSLAIALFGVPLLMVQLWWNNKNSNRERRIGEELRITRDLRLELGTHLDELYETIVKNFASIERFINYLKEKVPLSQPLNIAEIDHYSLHYSFANGVKEIQLAIMRVKNTYVKFSGIFEWSRVSWNEFDYYLLEFNDVFSGIGTGYENLNRMYIGGDDAKKEQIVRILDSAEKILKSLRDNVANFRGYFFEVTANILTAKENESGIEWRIGAYEK